MKRLKSAGLAGEAIPLAKLIHIINLKLAALGCATVETDSAEDFNEVARAILAHGTSSAAEPSLCPADKRIQNYLDSVLGDMTVKLPTRTFTLDQYGLSRVLSLPVNKDEFHSDIISSYRAKNGVLHNPKSDRRTTQGIFHVVEGGLPIPADKSAVPREVFARMLKEAFNPPRELMTLPFTYGQSEEAACIVSLMLRPLLCPEVPGFISEKRMETRFFAPGNLVSNLDFVESIFGNGGDPYEGSNDAGLDVEHWSGHTGCVILAPHLIYLTKKELGLPHYDSATARQRHDGMCWKEETDRYNNGNAFKLTCRDKRGVIVTLIADNYFGYCKKEVKTQLSYAANLFGLVQEEHAGGALVYPSYDLGEEFSGNLHVRRLGHSFAEVQNIYSDLMEVKPEGYGVDLNYPNIIYVPEDVHFDLGKQTISWPKDGKPQTLRLMADKTYVRPSGYKVHIEKIPDTKTWRMVGTVAEGLLCHKPCTVSGGGKSEISKPISDAILQGPVFVADFQHDFDEVEKIINRDFSDRFLKPNEKRDNRTILSHERSLGSVIKLLTPSQADYSADYNQWLNSIPQHIKELVFVVKRFYKPEWGNAWRKHFTVDIINGTPGNELKCDGRKLVANYLRVGYEENGSWRTFGLRQDFHPAAKTQMEDDITASVVIPTDKLNHLTHGTSSEAVKFVQNCEFRLFQRPDDAIHRGYDKVTERDFSGGSNFFSNYQPLKKEDAREILDEAIGFDQFTEPMQKLVQSFWSDRKSFYFISSAHPRIIDGKPTKNPRYLQTRPDILNSRDVYLAQVASRLQRRRAMNHPIHTPVGAVLPGRRNNPPDKAANIRPLAVYNPIHYMELPELFMEFICSMTGKSPSTTGAGSEGALTKGPFNALPPIFDLNYALVDFLLTGYQGFVTAAGYVGPQMRVDHDVSLLVPEIWSRMKPEERDANFMIKNGFLEKIEDITHDGKQILASRLGYRITQQFVIIFFGRVFNHPHVVLTEEMLKPELQSMEVFVEGMENILATQKRVADLYFEDGSVEMASPPLKALLHIMAHGHFEGKKLTDPEIRTLFTKKHLMSSDWYQARLLAKQKVDTALWQKHVDYLHSIMTSSNQADEEYQITVEDRLAEANAMLRRVQSPGHLDSLHGTLGAEPALV
ncbi:MAG: hypothetical protein ACO1QB_09300 [Verrucomicrobiales bacterium]